MNLKRKILALVALLAVPVLAGCGASSAANGSDDSAGNKADPQQAAYDWSTYYDPIYVSTTFSVSTTQNPYSLQKTRSVYLCLESPTSIYWCTPDDTQSSGYAFITRTPLYTNENYSAAAVGTVVVNNLTYSKLQYVWAVDNPISDKVIFSTNMGWNGLNIDGTDRGRCSFMLPVVYYNSAALPTSSSKFKTWRTAINNAGAIAFRTNYGVGGTTAYPQIKIPSSQTHVMPGAFTGCTSLKSVDLTYNTIKYIDTQAFEGCTGMSTITLPDSVTNIGFAAFANCTSLAFVHIPATIVDIDLNAFYRCTSLKSLDFAGNATYTLNTAAEGDTAGDGINDAKSMVLIDNGTKLYFVLPGCSAFTIPTTVTEISVNAFASCTFITSMVIPEGVTILRRSAFLNCLALTSITLPVSLTNIYDFVFGFDTALTTINYSGTLAQWSAVTKATNWHGSGTQSVPSTTVVTCTDGTVSIND
jgi:hypothetical protein